MENRTFTISYDTELMNSNNNVNVHIGVSSLSVSFTQLDLGVTSHRNGDESSQVFLPNYDDISVSNVSGGYPSVSDVSGYSGVSGQAVEWVPPLQGRPYVPRLNLLNVPDVSGNPPPNSFDRAPLQGPRNDFNGGFFNPEHNFPISVSGNPVFENDSDQTDYEEFIESISVENLGEEVDIDNQCSICLQQMSEETKHTTGCNHSFHRQCLNIWENRHSSCPLCRANLHNHEEQANIDEVEDLLDEELNDMNNNFNNRRHQRRNALVINPEDILRSFLDEEPANGGRFREQN